MRATTLETFYSECLLKRCAVHANADARCQSEILRRRDFEYGKNDHYIEQLLTFWSIKFRRCFTKLPGPEDITSINFTCGKLQVTTMME